METLGSLEELRRRLEDRVRSPSKQIAVIGGHYAINKNGLPEVACEGAFGIFPQYTFELACHLVDVSKQYGGNSKIALIVDDHSLMRNSAWYSGPQSDNTQAQQDRKVVDSYFGQFELPAVYKRILENKGLTEQDLLSASQEVLPFQESRYRTLFEKSSEIPATCAVEYLYILSSLANQGVDRVIALIPQRCMGPTCHGADSFKVLEERRQATNRMGVTHAYLLSNSEVDSVELLEEKMRENGGINFTYWGR